MLFSKGIHESQSLVTKTLNYAKYQNKFISKKITNLLPEQIYRQFGTKDQYQNIIDFIEETNDSVKDFGSIEQLSLN